MFVELELLLREKKAGNEGSGKVMVVETTAVSGSDHTTGEQVGPLYTP